MSASPRKLLDRVRDNIGLKHYSYRTEESYVYWIWNKCHPDQMDAPEIEAFLTHLAMNESVAASTQNQASMP
jgi:hypothetical protein